MRNPVAPKPRVISTKSEFTIVASRYNEQFTDALVNHCVAELEDKSPGVRVNIVRVPGAFEIPVAVEKVLNAENPPSVVVALGLIIQGATAHAHLVADTVTRELASISVRHETPVIHEVLLVEDEKQAYARCIGANLNRGREAAQAGISMAETFKQLDRITE